MQNIFVKSIAIALNQSYIKFEAKKRSVNLDATKRRMKILDMFQSQNTLKISFISKKLNVSRETIRGDLSVLQDQGKVTLIRGGAILIVSKDETPYEKRLDFMVAEKNEIAESFCNCIKEGDTIYLDFGTTSLFVAQKLHRFKKLTVVTNSLPIINELYKDDNIALFVLGGRARKNEGSFVGEIAHEYLDSLNINIGFFSGGGFDTKVGLSNFSIDESKLSRIFVKKCLKVAVGVDHSKFNQIYTQNVASIEDIDILISDTIDRKIYKKLEDKIPEVISRK